MRYICITGDILSSVQVNVRTTPFLVDELDKIVKDGYFRNRTEAVNEAIRLLVKRYELAKIKTKIESIREDTEKYPGLSDIVESIHSEEDK
jgi:Arc/MetJ-type ribon-helix-helix transcriptional regulator